MVGVGLSQPTVANGHAVPAEPCVLKLSTRCSATFANTKNSGAWDWASSTTPWCTGEALLFDATHALLCHPHQCCKQGCILLVFSFKHQCCVGEAMCFEVALMLLCHKCQCFKQQSIQLTC